MLRAHFILSLIVLLTPMSVIVLFIMALSQKHIKTAYVFVGHLGNYPIESCIFSASFNLSSAFHLLLCFLRYLQQLHRVKDLGFPEKRKAKLKSGISTSLACGILAYLGLSISCSFQPRFVPTLHFVGLSFFCGFNFTYLLFQTYFTFVLTSKTISIFIKCVRVGIVTLMFVLQFYIPVFIIYLIIKHSYLVSNYDPATEYKKQGDPIYKTGILVEWVLFCCCELYYVTFYPEFKLIGLRFDRIVFVKRDKIKAEFSTLDERRRTLSVSSQFESQILKQLHKQNQSKTLKPLKLAN